MAIQVEQYQIIQDFCKANGTTLVAVSKTKPAEDIAALYAMGHRDFGENYVQELVDKAANLAKDIHWHFIGHLQSNKAKLIAPFVYMIHGVDSANLLQEINKQAAKNNRVIDCLLQIHIAQEETKFGLDANELDAIMQSLKSSSTFQNVRIRGLMGMASFSNDLQLVAAEFATLKTLFDQYKSAFSAFDTLSMGMSGDYQLAIQQGSNMVRIGSLLFGERNYAAK